MSVGAGQAEAQQGAQVQGCGAGVDPGVVRDGAAVAQASVAGGHRPGDGAFHGWAPAAVGGLPVGVGGGLLAGGGLPVVVRSDGQDACGFRLRAFPSPFEFVDRLTADPSGQPIPSAGTGALKIVFTQAAQAHTPDGSRSSILSQPDCHLGLSRLVDYARAGDFEGVLSYGVGIAWPIPLSTPQIQMRVYEVERVGTDGRHLYSVAFDVDATNP